MVFGLWLVVVCVGLVRVGFCCVANSGVFCTVRWFVVAHFCRGLFGVLCVDDFLGCVPDEVGYFFCDFLFFVGVHYSISPRISCAA